MFLAPINFYTSLSLVPVFSWEPIEPTEETTPPPPPAPVACEDTAAEASKEPEDTPRELRLVFKGFAWCPGVHIHSYPEASWMRGYSSVTAETGEATQAQDQEKARARKAALAAQQRALADAAADVAPTTPVPSEPE